MATVVDTEAGSPLEGVELNEDQMLKLYQDGVRPYRSIHHPPPSASRPPWPFLSEPRLSLPAAAVASRDSLLS